MGVIDKVELYLITDDRRSLGRAVEEVAGAARRAGVRMIQYRPDRVSDAEFHEKSRRLRRITAPVGCLLIINDRADVALAADADGVHLGRGDMPIREARAMLGGSRLIGYSAHGIEEAARAAREGADFITYSPIFPTTSHSRPRPVLGIDGLEKLMEETGLTIPVFPLGGIGLNEIGLLRKAGFRRAAVVTAVTEQPDMERAARGLLQALGNY